MVQVDQRGEDQKAAREVEMKYMAGDPVRRNEQRDATQDQHCKIGQGTPALAFLRGFMSSVIARDPEILRRVHLREHARAVAALRDAKSFLQREHSSKKET